MSARTQVADFLRGHLPEDFLVIGRAEAPDAVTRPTVVLWASTIAPLPAAPDGGRAYEVEFTCWVLVPGDRLEAIEAALDDALDLVLDAWQTLGSGLWSRAERDILNNAHGYRITATAVGQNGE